MIWVKVRGKEDGGNNIYIPQNLIKKLSKQIMLQFGLNRVEVSVCEVEDAAVKGNNTFDDPVEILCSEEVMKKLLIVETLVYQLIYREGALNIGPVIGFLLGQQFYYCNDRNMHGLTRSMDVYPKIGGLFIAFKDISIDWDNKLINGLYYENATRKWKYGKFPIPSAIFRRAFLTSQNTVERLREITDNRVFNSRRFDKWDTYKVLEVDKKFRKYLPETMEVLDVGIFHSFICKYQKIILKPSALSRGRGICFIDKTEENYSVYDYRASDLPSFYILKKNEIDEYIADNFVNRKYIIQQKLELATINGAPFDIRIVMGKNEDRNWYCRGIECRKAGQKNRITNISRGGQAFSINNAIKLAFGPRMNFDRVKKELISAAVNFCKIMDKTGEHFAEFGLDFAIDSQHHYWFIEANVRPVFRGFKAMNYSNYLHIRHMPLFYAASIAGFGRGAKGSEQKI
jgi:glutathione synthase/RimK-type ligase-like ATP-grasp enzyme